MNRKNFLRTAALGVVSGSVLLSACGGDSTNGKSTEAAGGAPAAGAADCNDLSSVSEADLKQREAVQYVTVSTDTEKRCSNCRFMQVGTQANGCNGCQLFKGPVNPEGNCKSWFKKDA